MAGVLILYGHGQGLPRPHQDGQLPGPGQPGIDQVAEQHFEMLGQDRHDDGLEFAPLGFMDRDGIGQIELGDGIARVVHDPAVRVEGDRQRQILGIDRADGADVAVEHVEVIVVPAVDHPVAHPENPLAHRQLVLARLGGIGRFLDHPVQTDRPQTAPGHGGENLDLGIFTEVFGDPFHIELSHNLRCRKAVMQR